MKDLAYCFYFSFDVDGFYDKLKSVEAEYVLQNCMTTSEGYSNLMEAMCRYSETLKWNTFFTSVGWITSV